ncbi:ATP-dependent zinc metalloprotease FtsH [Streptomyces sp. NPDC056255]|uniref:ATP-dependent zinc metalloprotease FtsH n=1 Tax=Streptomyces sp. NPDC056255 TaxID=3345764 RepID=UPI0035DA030C
MAEKALILEVRRPPAIHASSNCGTGLARSSSFCQGGRRVITAVRLLGRHLSRSARPGPPRDAPKPSAPSPVPWSRWLLPIAALVLLIVVLIRTSLPQESAALPYSEFVGRVSAIGRARAKIIETERPTTRFEDVAGYGGVKQEISEIVDFLRSPERYAVAGAKGPRGVIMVGPPGTGKTLIARAVAGEAEVPFLSVTGSAFVEMFVGVGASRVRDLFAEARKRAPSIIFIDEIDAVGSRRSGAARLGGNDEREQTLNQLLAEMDGFDQASGIVVLAATNRPEALDPALLRPGRFDRHVTVPLPNQTERAAILAVHARGKTLAPDVDWDTLARATPGFSGADLANLVNEAAINAVRAGGAVIDAQGLDDARDRLLLGRRESTNALLPEERQSVAVHESGHALTAALCDHADPVAKVTILPSGPSLGATEQLPEAERHLYSEGYLTDLLTVRLGGRAAELVVFGEGSTGAADDLAGATQLAVRMVREFGLSPALGPIGYGPGAPRHLGGESTEDTLHRPYSEQTQRIVDEETRPTAAASRETRGGSAARPPGGTGHPCRSAHHPRDRRRICGPRRAPAATAAGRPPRSGEREADTFPVTLRR